jgi:hypothetical protein
MSDTIGEFFPQGTRGDSMIHRDSASTFGKEDPVDELTLDRPRLALIWLAAVVLSSLVPFAGWLAAHLAR